MSVIKKLKEALDRYVDTNKESGEIEATEDYTLKLKVVYKQQHKEEDNKRKYEKPYIISDKPNMYNKQCSFNKPYIFEIEKVKKQHKEKEEKG